MNFILMDVFFYSYCFFIDLLMDCFFEFSYGYLAFFQDVFAENMGK